MAFLLPDGVTPGGRYSTWARSKPRFVVADVDGTLVGDGPLPRPDVVRSIRQAEASGLRIGIATARFSDQIAMLEERLRLTGPNIVLNGAQVVRDGVPVGSWPIRHEIAGELIKLAAAERLYAEFFTAEGFYVSDRRSSMLSVSRSVSGDPQGLVDALDLRSTPLLKATFVISLEDQLGLLQGVLSRIGVTSEGATTELAPDLLFLNVTDIGINKGSALTWCSHMLGLNLGEICAIGDSLNDLSMFGVVGTAIAMGQSSIEVQQQAHIVVPEVGEDGVAHALRAAVSSWAQ